MLEQYDAECAAERPRDQTQRTKDYLPDIEPAHLSHEQDYMSMLLEIFNPFISLCYHCLSAVKTQICCCVPFVKLAKSISASYVRSKVMIHCIV